MDVGVCAEGGWGGGRYKVDRSPVAPVSAVNVMITTTDCLATAANWEVDLSLIHI